ncbi:MAG TPA: hypothetical protein ENJ44_00160 [Oceanospirillales bacterium]|nr:hypothetical protein [Oceanospirillales bacterium]
MALHALQSGYMLREYRIKGLLGEGGFGLTYLAYDTHLEKKVAIKEYMPSEHAIRENDSKIVPKSESSQKVYKWGLNAFINEAKTLAKFEDPNIVRVYRFFEENGTAYIVMEYCEGGCLVDRIEKGKPMDEAELKMIISAVVHGLQQVHSSGVLHRDIKPDNIMFRSDGTPVLIDFGAARQAIGDKSRKVTTIITPGYAPLEQYSSKGEIGPWSDIYSLAAVAYLCITGEKPPDIMNRLHEDTIVRLSENKNATPFLRAIDAGLRLQVQERPQNLSEWSSIWDEERKQVFNSRNSIKPDSSERIIKNSAKNYRRPISARTSLQPDELTIVNTRLNFEEKPSLFMSFFKMILTIALLAALGFGGYLAYNYYQEQQNKQRDKKLQVQQIQELPVKVNDEKQTSSDISNLEVGNTLSEQLSEQDSEIVKKVQKRLNLLGYPVAQDGQADVRTVESIKSFEEKAGLVITGKADAILLEKLNEQLLEQEKQEWQQAQESNNLVEIQAFIIKFPNSQYVNDAKLQIEQINKQKEIELEQLALAAKREEIQKALAEKRQEVQKQEEKLDAIKQQKSLVVKDVKSHLKRLKYKNLVLDDNLDYQTKDAIKAFQKLKGRPQTGKATPELLDLLQIQTQWPGKLIGQKFKDCENCPTMIQIPSGHFMMGDNSSKENQRPTHNVNIHEFALSTTETTFEQWDACYKDGFCAINANDYNLGRINRAVSELSRNDIKQFLQWLNKKTKKNYRLPSESEWEYAARAGTTTLYYWRDTIGTGQVDCDGCGVELKNKELYPVKKFAANKFGLYDMLGNVWEWTADCWHPNYYGAPSDNEAWEPNDCTTFVIRGGSSINKPEDLTVSNRGNLKADQKHRSLGFRVALDSN